jgi:signal transduction histidine kinase
MRPLRKLWPTSLYGQILLVTAVALFFAQAASTALLFTGAKARFVVEASSMLVARVSNQIERQRVSNGERNRNQRGRGERSRGRAPILVITSDVPLKAEAFAFHDDLAERATEYLTAVDPDVQSVRMATGPIEGLPKALRQAVVERSKGAHNGWNNNSKAHDAVYLTMKTGNGQWVSAAAYIRPFGGQPFLLLFVQTIVLYLAVLIPLALIAKRIARPLRSLTDRVHQYGLVADAPPLEPQGPSDVRDLMLAFNAAQSRLNSMLTEKDVMLGAIGHDLKTPLASLRVRIESVDDDVEREKMAATVTEMAAILDDILMLARVGNSAEPAMPTDIRALVDTVIDEFAENSAITASLGDDRSIAIIRPFLLKRAVRNLIDNALQYGGNARVSISPAAETIDLLVEDDGPGIAAEKIQEMFEPFARAETSRNREHGGTGLGLTIARTIALAHGGALQLENRAGGGLRARLTINR